MAKKSNNPAKDESDLLSTTEFGKKIGVSRQRVVDGIKSGLLSESVQKTTQRGREVFKIHGERGVIEWQENIDPSKQRDPDKAATTREMADDGKRANSNYQQARTAKEFFNAKLAELEYQQKAKKLVSADRVRAETYKIARRVRDSLMAVPERVSSEVANMDEPRQIAVYIKEHIALALKDLSDLDNVGQSRE